MIGIQVARLPGRSALAAVAVAAMVVANVAAVAADVPPEQSSGITGAAGFRESAMIAAPICVYPYGDPGVTSAVAYFRVREPRVFWPGSAPGNHGTVGWRVKVQEFVDPSTDVWYAIESTPIRLRTAYDDSPADFGNRTVDHGDRLSDVYYRLMSQIYWYDGEGHVIGWVKHWYQWYGRSVSTGIAPGWSGPASRSSRPSARTAGCSEHLAGPLELGGEALPALGPPALERLERRRDRLRQRSVVAQARRAS